LKHGKHVIMPRRSRSATPRRRASARLKQTVGGSPEPRDEERASTAALQNPNPPESPTITGISLSHSNNTAMSRLKDLVGYEDSFKPLWPLVALFLLMKYEEVNNCTKGLWYSLPDRIQIWMVLVLIFIVCSNWVQVFDKCAANKSYVTLFPVLLTTFSKALNPTLKRIMQLDHAGPLEVGKPLMPAFWTNGTAWCSTEWCGEKCEGFNDNAIEPITDNSELIFLMIFLWYAFYNVKNQVVGIMVTKEEATSKGMPATLFDLIDSDSSGDISGEEFTLWWGKQSINVRQQIEKNMDG